MKPILMALAALMPFTAQAQTAGQSAYAGFEARDIKALSESDLDDLRRGAGWGLALAAELNGVPGPAHLLELQDRIGLSAEPGRGDRGHPCPDESRSAGGGCRFHRG
jgi:hypothetical protein